MACSCKLHLSHILNRSRLRLTWRRRTTGIFKPRSGFFLCTALKWPALCANATCGHNPEMARLFLPGVVASPPQYTLLQHFLGNENSQNRKVGYQIKQFSVFLKNIIQSNCFRCRRPGSEEAPGKPFPRADAAVLLFYKGRKSRVRSRAEVWVWPSP